MGQTAEECLDFLARAEEAVKQLSAASERLEQLEQDEKKQKRSLETERRRMGEETAQTVKKRREELSQSYDGEIGKAQEQLKKARVRREKAKNQGMKERIAEETQELHAHNQELRGNMKTAFRRGHVPVLCRSRLYYSLYFPRWAGEWLTLFLYVLLFYLLLPYGLYLLAPERRTVFLAICYGADILVVGGIYMLIGNHTKLQYMETLRQGRQILDQIHANNRKIRVITSTIRKDRNESLYDLEKYDDEIARLSQELNQVAAKKRDAMNTFETVTKTILQDEIEMEYGKRMDQIEKEYQETERQLQEVSALVKEQTLSLSEHYGGYLGKEFLDSEKLEELAELIRSGQALSISEAVGLYKSSSK